MPGQCEEDIVESGSAQADVEYADASCRQKIQRRDQRVGAVVDRNGDATDILLNLNVPHGKRAQFLADDVEMLDLVHTQFNALTPDPRLQLICSTARDDRAAVDDGDLVGQPLGFLHVLRREQQRGPLSHQLR